MFIKNHSAIASLQGAEGDHICGDRAFPRQSAGLFGEKFGERLATALIVCGPSFFPVLTLGICWSVWRASAL